MQAVSGFVVAPAVGIAQVHPQQVVWKLAGRPEGLDPFVVTDRRLRWVPSARSENPAAALASTNPPELGFYRTHQLLNAADLALYWRCPRNST